jgi:hypothetical protein
MGGVNASRDNNHMIQKQIRILENRLDKALIKFNEAIAHNKTLRDTIDDLRRERVVYENIYRKMERELQERKQKMAEIIELSNQSYEQRDNYQMEVAAIEQANRKEQEEFEEQMIELGKMLETDLALPTPGLKTNTMANTSRINTVNNHQKENSDGNDMFDNRAEMKGSPSRSKINTTKSSTAAMERVQNFEEAFNKIKAATGISDIEGQSVTIIKF